jgi:hypothetical protein
LIDWWDFLFYAYKIAEFGNIFIEIVANSIKVSIFAFKIVIIKHYEASIEKRSMHSGPFDGRSKSSLGGCRNEA